MIEPNYLAQRDYVSSMNFIFLQRNYFRRLADLDIVRYLSSTLYWMLDFFLCIFYSSHGKSQYKSLQGKTSSKAKQVRQGVWLQGCQGNQENLLQKEAQFA